MVTLRFPDGQEDRLSAPDAVNRLIHELELIGAQDVGQQLAVCRGSKTGVFMVADENARPLARALDHLRNLEPEMWGAGFTQDEAAEELRHIRDHLLDRLDPPPLTYHLQSWQFGGKERTFFSYSGQYEKGDRLVAGSDEAFHVVDVRKQATQNDDGVLFVELWNGRLSELD
jgi:hypothetical protein